MSKNQSRRNILQSVVMGGLLWPSRKSFAKDIGDFSESVSEEAADGPALISRLVAALRAINKPVCIQEANRLASSPLSTSGFDLHLRRAGLIISDATIIADALQRGAQQDAAAIRSFSVSFNPELKDAGVIALANALPLDLREIGMVGCDFGDEGAEILLSWVRENAKLRMICIEQNRLSAQMRQRYSTMGKRHGKLLVIT